MWSKLFTTVKYILVTVNFLFLITGIVILSVGGSVQSAYNGYHPFLSERFFSLPAFCIATGIIIFLISFLGFYGAFMENYIVNMVFAGAMIVMFIFQLSACIAGYVLKGNTVVLVQHQLISSMDLYGVNKSIEVTKLWDEVQEDFQCCGVNNASDWFRPLGTQETQGLPVSCCNHVYGAVATFDCTLNTAHATGCSESFGYWVQSHAAGIGIAGIFLVLMQKSTEKLANRAHESTDYSQYTKLKALAVAGALWMAKISREERGAYP